MKTKNNLIKLFSVGATFCVSTIAIFSFFMHSANADPVLSVSVSPDIVLLGGQATYTITVENTDSSDKGYNLSFSSIFSSDRTDPEGQVTFYSASDSRGNIAPTSSTTNGGTGDTTIDFINLRDLAPNETYSFTLTVNMSGDATWEAMDELVHNLTATVNTMPDGSGTDVSGTDSDTSEVLPIALIEKVVNQSTGVEQATGTVDRVYSYEIDVQNNYTNATNNVTITDTLPDGIEFLGITSGHTCTDSRDNATGITTIICDFGTMLAGANETIEFDAGIRYDYFGTENGGTNRTHDDFDGTPATGTPIPNKTVLTNHVDLDAEYQGSAVATQSDDEPVTAAYATISKSGNISNGGNGDTIDYTLTYSTSEYYNILDDNVDSNTSSITMHDLLPDGQTFVTDSATPTQTSWTANSNGTTDIYWNSSVLNALAHSGSFNVTFSATVDNAWDNGDLIVAADRMTNTVDSHGEWDDQIDEERANAITDSVASANFEMETPLITKEVADGDGGWIDATTAGIGDDLTFRVRFNTNDGENPIVSNVNLGDIVVTDWLPPGMSYNNDAVETFSGSETPDFTGSNYDGPPTTTTIGGLVGIEWELGDINSGGWWQAIFTARVEDSVEVFNGRKVNNIWKMTGINSFDESYSDRDKVEITYQVPQLILDKNATNVPSPLVSGSAVEYTVTIENAGARVARDILFTDTVAMYMDDATPTITSIHLGSTLLSQGTDYNPPTWNGSTREFAIDFNDGEVQTNISTGETLTIVYTTTVDADAGAGRWFNNVATVAYNSQSDGSGRVVAGTSDPNDDNTDNAGVGSASASINKSVPVGPYNIGDELIYTLDITIPQGQIFYWPNINDVLDKDGVNYVASSATLTDISGTPVTPATFDAGSESVITTVGSDNTELLWNLANPIDNREQGSDYVFRLEYRVVYNGIEDDGTSWELFPPTDNDQLINTASIHWANYPAESRATNVSVNDNATINIDQPLLSTVKTITSPDPHMAGGAVDYQIVLTNDGEGTAYDITLDDDISQFVNNTTLTSITHSSNGVLNSGSDYVANFSGDPLTIIFNSSIELEHNETLTIIYSATINDSIGSGVIITNIADVDWESANGVRIYNDNEDSVYTADTDDATIALTSIGDKVWRDDERDGIQADWEPGLAGVTVELLDGTGTPVDDPSNPGTPYTVVTDVNGNYLFENLEAGNYQVRFTPPANYNATNQNAGSDDALDSDIDTTTLTTDTFTIALGEGNTSVDAGFYVLYTDVFDPPSASKTVGESGDNEVEWTMVWINSGNLAAINTQILDNVPTGTTYIADSLECDARGASTTSVCVYDATENRVRWEGDIAPDEGGTNEENSLNEVVIVYRTTVSDSINEIENQAQAYWDADGSGEFDDDIERGQTPVNSDDPTTVEPLDPTVWTRSPDADGGSSSIGNYIWLDRDGDGKQDDDEEGIENIRVKLTWAGPDGEFGNSDDYVWRTDTNHNGHYLFENLPEGRYEVEVKEEDLRGLIQTYDPGSTMNNRASINLGVNDHHTKADFGYNNEETELARTGDNFIIWLLGLLAGGLSLVVLKRKKWAYSCVKYASNKNS